MTFHVSFGLVQDLAVMIYSIDEEQNKVLVYVGVPNSAAKRGLVALDWLRASSVPINGKGVGVKHGLAQGQVKNLAYLSRFYHSSISKVIWI